MNCLLKAQIGIIKSEPSISLNEKAQKEGATMKSDDFERIIISQTAPLSSKDTMIQTYGCRHSNWEICKNAMTSTCAFSSQDKICTTPSRKWKTIYEQLKKQ
jgi:hypothetical protein